MTTVETERREASRNRTILGAQAVFNDGRSTIDCVVKNLSAKGALLTLPEPTSLPQSFQLRVNGRDETWAARVTRRSLKGVAVSF